MRKALLAALVMAAKLALVALVVAIVMLMTWCIGTSADERAERAMWRDTMTAAERDMWMD